jgi:HSP20 family protein
MDTLFRASDGQDVRVPSAGAFPMVNVGETPQDVRVYVLAPGLGADEVEIELQGNLLTIHGRRATEADDEATERKRTWYRNERFHGEFRRTVLLPESIDGERVQARAQDGVITVSIAKREETHPRRIDVKAA